MTRLSPFPIPQHALSTPLSNFYGRSVDIFINYLRIFELYSRTGEYEKAEISKVSLDQMGYTWDKRDYSPGKAEIIYNRALFWNGTLQKEHIERCMHLIQTDYSRELHRQLLKLTGEWYFERGDFCSALDSFKEAAQMAREIKVNDSYSETWLALTKYKVGQLADLERIAEELSLVSYPTYRPLAELWLLLENLEEAKKQAVSSYKWAWASGEPFVNRYELNKSTELLNRLSIPIPKLPDYHPEQDEQFSWEKEVRDLIRQYKKE